MKKTANKLKIFLYSVTGLTVLCSVLFTISMFIAFDADVGYFSNTKILPYIQTALMTVSIISFLSIIFLFPKKELPAIESSNSPFGSFASLFCGFAFIGGTAIKYFSTYQNAANMSQSQKYTFTAIILSGIVAAIYFIADALTSNKKLLSLKVIAGIFVIINLIFTIIFEHTDYFVPINAPRKTLLFLGFISAAMFMVQEFRAKTDILLPKAYIIFGSSTALICATFSISGLIAHYSGAFKCSSFLVYYLIALALAVYATSKTFTYLKLVEETIPVSEENEE